MNVFLVLVCLSVNVNTDMTENKYKLPTYIQRCHRSDPDLEGCIVNSVEQLRPRLAQGIPELSVPSCDPLHIPELLMSQGRGLVAVNYTYSDVFIHGAADFILHSLKMDLEKNTLRVNLTLPKIRMRGNYAVSGQILMLPIVGHGSSEGNYTDVHALADCQLEQVVRYGQVYLHVADIKLNCSISHASLHLSDLFNGDKDLGEAMNIFINDNWRSIAEDIKPVIEDIFEEMVMKFANKIFHKFTLDELLPP